MKTLKLTLICFFAVLVFNLTAQKTAKITTGADQPETYLKLLQGKRVGFVGNNTAVTGKDNMHLVDFLKSKKINVVKVFAPEHGFRGAEAAGAKITDGVDEKTGIPVVSLYNGKKYKPSAEQIADLDVIVYDIQDVGCRFYTYISTMAYVMEAAAESGKKFIVLDRPNPNGYFIDGPVLDMEFKSFAGMHPVPVVYGMTAGEYAKMVNEEGWLAGGVKCDLTVIPCKGYDHTMRYNPPIAPSPNLPNAHSVNLYTVTCFFEGTPLSEGRGSEAPFEIFGSPKLPVTGFTFTPVSGKLKGQLCNGVDLRSEPLQSQINLDYLIWAYENYYEPEKFFNRYFDTLAGGVELRELIIAGKSNEEIHETWKQGLAEFNKMRKKYLLYKDFK